MRIIKVKGPYLNKPKGRMFVHVHYDNGKTRYTSYARYLMEQHLGRELETYEEVDHINDDKTDDRIENLQILSPTENKRKSTGNITYITCICPACGVEFERNKRQIKSSQIRLGRAGPFCSRKCATPHRRGKIYIDM